MLIVIGLAIVLGSVLGGFLPHGDLRVLWQPLEVLIIVGSALGAFIIANPLSVQLGVLRNLKVLFRDAPHPKAAYLELLTLLYTLFKLARSKGMLALETHLEHPYQSELFSRFPHFVANHHAVEFLCDYLRLISLGAEKAHEIEELMAADLATHHAEMEQIAGSLTTMSDGLPAFGIVAAVLGIIVAMGSLGGAAGGAGPARRRRAHRYVSWRADRLRARRADRQQAAVLFCRRRPNTTSASRRGSSPSFKATPRWSRSSSPARLCTAMSVRASSRSRKR